MLQLARRILGLAKTNRTLADVISMQSTLLSEQGERFAVFEAYVRSQPWYDDEEFEIVQREMKKRFDRAAVDAQKEHGAQQQKDDAAREVEKALELLKSFDGPEQ